MSKQISVLYEAGIVRRGYGGRCAIQPQFRIPGESAIDLCYALPRLK